MNEKDHDVRTVRRQHPGELFTAAQLPYLLCARPGRRLAYTGAAGGLPVSFGRVWLSLQSGLSEQVAQ